MTTVHLTDAQRDTFAACGLIVIDSEAATEPCEWFGGRRVVTLTATCLHLNAVTLYPDALDGYWRCPECGADDARPDGVVTFGRFTIPALLPVVVGDKGSCPGTPHVNVLYLPNDTLVGLCDGGGNAPLIEAVFDPLPRPGQFIAHPERVTTRV